jgi:signal transduction histidine kinase
LTYDKLDSNDLKLHTREINVQELVLSNCKGFANQARNLGIRLNLLNRDADMDLSNVFVDVDSGKIGQVLRNLISNALKFTPVDGTIDVSVRFVREMSMNAATFGSYDEAIVTGSGDIESGIGHDGPTGGSAGTYFFHSSPPQSYVHADHPPSKPHYVRIDVKDSGVGLSVEKQQQLFDGVVQFEDRESINRFGAGLGLYSKYLTCTCVSACK